MRFFKPFALLAVAALSVVVFTSAIPYSGKSAERPAANSTNISKAASAWEKAAAYGNISNKELKSIVTELKGGKLTLKEKIGLKLFGRRIANKMETAVPASGEKSQLVAVLLCGFLGCLGIHRFYLGYTWQGVVQLLTLGGCGIWALIDFIRILIGDLQPKNGPYDTTL